MSTAMDPTTLARALKHFDQFTFTTVEWVDLDPCSGCPSHPACEPLASEAVISYRRYLGVRNGKHTYSHTYSQPVGGCCLEQELGALRRAGITEVHVQILVFVMEEAVA